MSKSCRVVAACLFAAACVSIVLADWGAPIKWNQFDNPDPQGRRIESWSSSQHDGQLVADDFRCTQTGFLNEIRVRGANDGFNLGVKVFIWADVPATGNEESHPGTLLKSWTLGNASPSDPNKVGWYDTGTGEYRIDLPQNDWFLQQGTPANPIIYWVGVEPQHDIFGFEKFRWNYRDNLSDSDPNPPDIHNLDDAVVGNVDGSGNWRHLGAYYYTDPIFGDHYWVTSSYTGKLPAGWRSMDMEFQVYGTPEPASLGLLAIAGLALLLRR